MALLTYPEMMIGVVDGITSLVETGQAAVIKDLNAQFADREPRVILTPYRSFYISPKYEMYRCPALVVMGSRTTINLAAQNYLDEKHEVHVISVVEDENEEKLTRLCELYPILLHALLDQQSWPSPMGSVFTLLMATVEYNPILVSQDERRVFRRDVTTVFNVEHQEQWGNTA